MEPFLSMNMTAATELIPPELELTSKQKAVARNAASETYWAEQSKAISSKQHQEAITVFLEAIETRQGVKPR